MRIFLIATSLFLSACSASLSDYKGSEPKFDLQTYFTGDVTAWGMIQDYSGQMTRRFCVDIVGTWEGNKGQLHETFYFDDGEQQIRIWHLETQPDGTVTGGAGDVVGMASGAATPRLVEDRRHDREGPAAFAKRNHLVNDGRIRPAQIVQRDGGELFNHLFL